MDNKTTRRDFLKTCGMLGMGAAAVSFMPLAAEAATLGVNHKVTKTAALMGTYVAITAIDPSKNRAEEAIGRAFEEIQRLTAVFSRYDSATPVSVLNRDGNVSGIPAELATVMDRAQRLHALTDKAFDITVAPVVDMFQAKARAGHKLELSHDELANAMHLVNADNVTRTGDTVRFARSGMKVSLDGIAKGFIVDSASDVMASLGVANHMINAGGDICARGEKALGSPWKIAVEDPKQQGRYPDVIALRDGAVATSGNYQVYFDRDKLFHHIVNPMSGRSPLESVSVSVTAATVMEADALATSVYVMDPARGLAFINELPGRECLIIAQTGAKLPSRRWA
ncbi:MAG: FAD:protein FMN transferase [Desulfovibrionaceae bacterium]